MLTETPLAMPAIFSLAGPAPGELAVIERLETGATVHEGPQVAANHWKAGHLPAARPRGVVSHERAAVMREAAGAAGADLAWLQAPVLNPTTRLVAYMEPASGRLVAQGFETPRPDSIAPATAATEILPPAVPGAAGW